MLALGAGSGCGESSYDLYMRGLKQAGEAERIHCRLAWDTGQGALVINSESIIDCLQANQDALVVIEQAREAGFTGKDVDRTVLGLEQKILKLESRLRVVGYLERDAVLSDPG